MIGEASAYIGPFTEDHLFYRVAKNTGAIFCNHLEPGSTWSISSTYNLIWQVDSGTPVDGVGNWNEDVNTIGEGNEAYFLTIIDRGQGRIGVPSDMDFRCTEPNGGCQVRWAIEHQPPEEN
jgi:hypothetical protein